MGKQSLKIHRLAATMLPAIVAYSSRSAVGTPTLSLVYDPVTAEGTFDPSGVAGGYDTSLFPSIKQYQSFGTEPLPFTSSVQTGPSGSGSYSFITSTSPGTAFAGSDDVSEGMGLATASLSVASASTQSTVFSITANVSASASCQNNSVYQSGLPVTQVVVSSEPESWISFPVATRYYISLNSSSSGPMYSSDAVVNQIGYTSQFGGSFTPIIGSSLTVANGGYSGIFEPGLYSLQSFLVRSATAYAQSPGSQSTVNVSASATIAATFDPVTRLRVLTVGVDSPDFTSALGLPCAGLYGQLNASNFLTAIKTVPSYVSSINVPLLDTTPGNSNLQAIQTAASALQSQVLGDGGDGSGDTVLLYFNGHGNNESNGTLALSSAGDLIGANLTSILEGFPTATRKIVIMDSCESGAFGAAVSSVPNSILLAASGPSTLTYYNSYIGSIFDGAAPGTSFFTNALDAAIDAGVYDLPDLENSIGSVDYGSIAGEQFGLEAADGTLGTFSAPTPTTYANSDFTGDFLSPITVPGQAVPEPTGASLLLLSTAVLCRRRIDKA